MKNTERPAFNEALTAVYSLYRVSLSADLLAIWWNALKDKNLSDIRKALGERFADPEGGQYCPVPADVIKRIAPPKSAIEICDHCGIVLAGWTKFGNGRVCNPCYRDYLNGKWDPAKERAA